MAVLLGIPVDTLGTYERGVSEPGMTLLAMYRSRFGINLNWLATGEGDMFERSDTRIEPVEGSAMRAIAATVSDVYRQVGWPAEAPSATGHGADIYRRLIAGGVDINDEEAVLAHLPAHALTLRRQLQNAGPPATPGEAEPVPAADRQSSRKA